MGDFLLDLRPATERAHFRSAVSFLKFQENVVLDLLEFPEFSLALTSVDNPRLWSAHSTPDLLVAICGRIDLEESEWSMAEGLEGAGGSAAKLVGFRYKKSGSAALEQFSGNFTLIVWDRPRKLLFIVTDLCGAAPCFASTNPGQLAYSSHPDALAKCLGQELNWDEVSLHQFLLTSSVTPPFTFYRGIHSIDPGTLISIEFEKPAAKPRIKSYFQLTFIEGNASEAELAEELAAALTAAVRKRSLPRFGPTAVALSGGLDSRTVLAAARNEGNLFAFTCLNEANLEFRSARSVARALGIKLIPLHRSFDYYAENAELGLRIAGGMGTFANNHFLGVSAQLRDLGAQNLLTGCYFDYLFKALPLNLTVSPFRRKETLGPYSHQFYFDHYRMDRPAANAVLERLEARFPECLRNSLAPQSVFELEKLRTFPLFQEADNAQRLVPQRVLFSYLPAADRSLLNVYRKIPYHRKLNRSVFKKAVQIVCGPRVSRVPDANTGAPAHAGRLHEAFSFTALRLRNRLSRLRPSLATNGSWPDWAFYVPRSSVLKRLWQKSCPSAEEVLGKVFSQGDLRATPADYTGKDLFLFVQMLSLKIWISQRCSSES